MGKHQAVDGDVEETVPVHVANRHGCEERMLRVLVLFIQRKGEAVHGVSVRAVHGEDGGGGGRDHVEETVSIDVEERGRGGCPVVPDISSLRVMGFVPEAFCVTREGFHMGGSVVDRSCSEPALDHDGNLVVLVKFSYHRGGVDSSLGRDTCPPVPVFVHVPVEHVDASCLAVIVVWVLGNTDDDIRTVVIVYGIDHWCRQPDVGTSPACHQFHGIEDLSVVRLQTVDPETVLAIRTAGSEGRDPDMSRTFVLHEGGCRDDLGRPVVQFYLPERRAAACPVVPVKGGEVTVI